MYVMLLVIATDFFIVDMPKSLAKNQRGRESLFAAVSAASLGVPSLWQ